MVVVVTGASGQLGQAIRSISANYNEIRFHFATTSEADIADKKKLHQLFNSLRPDYCINAAAYTAVDKAESEPEKAYLINVVGVKNITEICNEYHTTLIHISTDFVFDGNKTQPYTENDAPNPQGIYAQTKFQGEQVVTAIAHKYFIIRTSWLYSDFGNNFMKTILRLANEQKSLNVVNDQIGTPTHAVELAKAILQIIRNDSGQYGIYHFSNEGSASWYEFAKEIFQINNIKTDLHPISTMAYPTPAKRPNYSVLDKTKIKNVFGIEIQHWTSALRKNKSATDLR